MYFVVITYEYSPSKKLARAVLTQLCQPYNENYLKDRYDALKQSLSPVMHRCIMTGNVALNYHAVLKGLIYKVQTGLILIQGTPCVMPHVMSCVCNANVHRIGEDGTSN